MGMAGGHRWRARLAGMAGEHCWWAALRLLSTVCQSRMSASFELLVNDFQIGLGLWGGATLHFLPFNVIPFLLVTPITCRNMSLEDRHSCSKIEN